ncbi:DUF1573 domain-containing protein [Halocola ammonii]
MKNGIKIILLAAVAVGLGVFAYQLSANDKGNDTKKSREMQTEQKAAKDGKQQMDLLENQKKEQAQNQPVTSIKFDEYNHDFGTINEGDSPEHVFTFTNTGDNPLILEKCKGSCGCTVPNCPKNPIAPGEKGEIKVVFNSKGKKNSQTKKVTVTGNTDPVQTILTIKAQVTPEGQSNS